MSKFNKLFTTLSFFTESPDYFEGGVFHSEMNDEHFNKTTFLNLKSNLIKKPSFLKYEVFENSHSFYGESNKTFYLVKDDIIEGAIEIETKSKNNFCLGVWQRNVPENKGLMRSFFINYLSQIYNSIVSGKTANKFGMSFWKKLLNYFVSNGLKVTILNGSVNNEEPYNNSTFEDYWTHVKRDKKSVQTFVSGTDKLFKFYF